MTVILVVALPIVRVMFKVIGTVERTSTSCAEVAKPCAVTVRWYGLKGTFGTANLPPASVTTERENPLIGLRTSTVALGTTAPEESATVPVMEVEAPDWA